ncbi:MAG: hypothetical protein R3F48_02095 [Candidatus Zixiibacteriota bacterium]
MKKGLTSLLAFSLLLPLCLLFPQSLPAMNMVDIYCQCDSLYYDVDMPLQIYFENDTPLYGFILGLEISSPVGTTWEWANADGDGFVTVVEGSRMYPPEDVWTATGGIVLQPYDIDMIGADSFAIGGSTVQPGPPGLPSGSYEHMMDVHFIPHPAGSPEEVGIICFDTAFIPPSGSLVFQDYTGDVIPVIGWAEGGRCQPVTQLVNCGPTISGISGTPYPLDHCSSITIPFGYISSGGGCDPYSVKYRIDNCTGVGQFDLNYNSITGNGTLTYMPESADAGKTIQITLEISTDCPPYASLTTAYIDVSGNPPELYPGIWRAEIGMNNLVTIDDIAATDVDLCDNVTYSIISGPGEIDGQTGDYTWNPTDEDLGEHWIVIQASDGGQTTVDSLYLNVIEDSFMWGNVDCNDGVNIGDAVSLINFIFKGRACPPIMNWADVNADCTVNVGDAVYLIYYIFTGGPAPQPGCVNR